MRVFLIYLRLLMMWSLWSNQVASCQRAMSTNENHRRCRGFVNMVSRCPFAWDSLSSSVFSCQSLSVLHNGMRSE
ncbi:uncharacterized protein BDW47DRAFT_110162 [Aspergillus candidus]|uniref:Secreted protein n=1 Tax=Aspergillus candidus TaxID=41067 RepID=A0A2I2F4P8_ASPCN|nr:hypothetical protein BDW47DRAFT_110162 [Aspergillus candidus]PLB35632.1 hypothetical protein BDW47DRAFT_110162 [Aspergillus candidus]